MTSKKILVIDCIFKFLFSNNIFISVLKFNGFGSKFADEVHQNIIFIIEISDIDMVLVCDLTFELKNGSGCLVLFFIHF